MAAPAFGFLAAGLAIAFSRWQWAEFCARACGPFLPANWPPQWVEEFRRSMDWQTPLTVAAAAALVLCALAAGRRCGRDGPDR